MSPQRRDVLRLGGVTALLTTGMAGCTEELPSGSDETAPTYADWLFDTDSLFEASFRGFYSVSVDAYLDQRAALPEEFRNAVEQQVGRYEGIELSDFDRVTGQGAFADPVTDDYGDEMATMTSVLTGDFDTEAVTETLQAESPLSSAGSYEGYDLYTHRSEYDAGDTRAAAVSEDAVVLTLAQAGDPVDGTPSDTPPDEITAERVVELHVDAKTGGADRLLSGNPGLDALATALDGAAVGGLALDPEMLRERTGLESTGGSADTGTPQAEEEPRDEDSTDGSGGTAAPQTPTVSEPEPSPIQRRLGETTRGLSAVGGSADAADGSGEVVVRLRYGSESEAGERAETVRDLRDALQAEVDALTVPEVAVSAEGATVVVDITGDPTAFYEELRHTGGGGGTDRAPQVAFSFERREDGRVTVTHDGGDEVGTDGTIGLLYESEGEGIEREWTPEDGSITAGDSLTTEQPVTGVLRVVWTSEDGGSSATLGLYRPREEDDQAAPRAQFDFVRRSDGSVTITHEGGDNIERGLIVRYDGRESPEKWAEENGAITAGDTYTTRGTLAEDGSVRVIWPGDDGPVVLAKFHTSPTPTPPERTATAGEKTATPTAEERTTPTETPDGTPTRTPEETRTATPTTRSTDTRTVTPSESGTPTRTPEPVGTSEGTASSTPSGN
jgi:hypothetical protein